MVLYIYAICILGFVLCDVFSERFYSDWHSHTNIEVIAYTVFEFAKVNNNNMK